MIVAIWAVLIIRLLWVKRPKYQPRTISKEVAKENDVTVEDMVLHDMANSDDVYDIGRVDFND